MQISQELFVREQNGQNFDLHLLQNKPWVVSNEILWDLASKTVFNPNPNPPWPIPNPTFNHKPNDNLNPCQLCQAIEYIYTMASMVVSNSNAFYFDSQECIKE